MIINEMNKGIEDIKKIRLTDKEKQFVLNKVLNTPIVSPYISKPSIWSSVQQPFAYAMASIAVFILAGAGITYASQGAIPGDLLYPVKISVSEPIQDALAFTPKARAEREVIKASTRIAEAEKLIQKNNLTPEYSKNIERELNNNIIRFNNDVSLVSTTTDNSIENLKASFEKSIKSNSAIIERISTSNTKINNSFKKTPVKEENPSPSNNSVINKNKPNVASVKNNTRIRLKTDDENSVNIEDSGRLEDGR